MVRLSRLVARTKDQQGVTLIELIIVLAITSLIGVAIVTLLGQVLTLNVATSNHMNVVKQVENALHYLNRDIQMASPFQSQLPASDTFPLTLIWTDYQSNNQHIVTYAISGGNLRRSEIIAGVAQPDRVVATHVETAGYTYNGASVTVNLTVTIDGAKLVTESRSLEVKLRPTS